MRQPRLTSARALQRSITLRYHAGCSAILASALTLAAGILAAVALRAIPSPLSLDMRGALYVGGAAATAFALIFYAIAGCLALAAYAEQRRTIRARLY